MKPNWKSLAIACGLAAGCAGAGASPARAQGFSFGYNGPGVSFGLTTPGYGYFGGGYYSGYPIVTPGPLVVSPVAPVVVRPPLVVPGLWIGPRAYVVRRPFGWYGPYPRYFRRW
jgi:hypothetical protein